MASILIIDDEDQIRRMMRTMLERAGYEVADAPNGKEGIEYCRKRLPDLVITDLIMPEKEGLETIIELRQEFPDLKIIAMSGGGRITADSYLGIARKFGAIRTFVKPIDRNDLLTAVEEALK